MSCHLWLSPTNCPADWVDGKRIHDAVWLAIILLVGICFAVSSIRRWRIVGTFQFNAYSIIDIMLWNAFLCWIIFYAMSLARVTQVLWLKSFFYYGGYTLCTSSVSIIVAVCLQLEKPVAFRNRNINFLNWPPPLLFGAAIFVLIEVVSSVTQGITISDKWYRVSYPLYLGTASVYFWSVISVLVLGTIAIKRRLNLAQKSAENKALSRDARRVHHQLNVIMIFLCGLVIFPASIGTTIVAVGASYVDGHYWTEETIYSCFQTFALSYVCYWIYMFWKAGTRGMQIQRDVSSNFSAGTYATAGAVVSGMTMV